MIRRIALAGAAGALVLGGLAASGMGTAGAATPTITTATSANISCTITAKAKLSPGLKNDWKQSQHTSDANADVAAIADTQFAPAGPTTTSAKSKSIACTGSATDGTNVATITGLKITLSAGTPAVDNPPLQEDGTCAGLSATADPMDVAATYTSAIKFKTTGAKLADTTVSGSTITPAGLGFSISGGTISGSLAGGNSKSQANIDATTAQAITTLPATSTNPSGTPGALGANNECEASIKIKAGPHHSAKLKGPKGLKKITIGQSILDPSAAGASNICIKKATGTC
jgi:hypothetical protein